MLYKLGVELTNHCNFRCVFCPHAFYKKDGPAGNRFDRKKGYMSSGLFDLCMKNAKRYASEVTLGFFGEQLLHPQFEEFVERIPKKRKYRLVLNTNWSLVSRKTYPILNRFDCVKVSLDAASSDLYSKLCPGPKGYMSQASRLIDWLREKNRPRTEIIYVTSSINKAHRLYFVDTWRPKLRKNDVVSTKSVITYGGVVKDSYMNRAACSIVRYKEKRLTVAWNGRCSPCNLDVNMSLGAGNLLYMRTIPAIVSSEKYMNAMRQIKMRRGICENCFDSNNRSKTKHYKGERCLSK